MQIDYIIISMIVMAGVTYLARVIPMIIFKKKIENRFVQSFLLYMPYGVLAAMVFPAILYSTSSLISAIAGAVVALILAYFKRGLVVVALSSCVTVFIVELILHI